MDSSFVHIRHLSKFKHIHVPFSDLHGSDISLKNHMPKW